MFCNSLILAFFNFELNSRWLFVLHGRQAGSGKWKQFVFSLATTWHATASAAIFANIYHPWVARLFHIATQNCTFPCTISSPLPFCLQWIMLVFQRYATFNRHICVQCAVLLQKLYPLYSITRKLQLELVSVRSFVCQLTFAWSLIGSKLTFCRACKILNKKGTYVRGKSVLKSTGANQLERTFAKKIVTQRSIDSNAILPNLHNILHKSKFAKTISWQGFFNFLRSVEHWKI